MDSITDFEPDLMWAVRQVSLRPSQVCGADVQAEVGEGFVCWRASSYLWWWRLGPLLNTLLFVLVRFGVRGLVWEVL